MRGSMHRRPVSDWYDVVRTFTFVDPTASVPDLLCSARRLSLWRENA